MVFGWSSARKHASGAAAAAAAMDIDRTPKKLEQIMAKHFSSGEAAEQVGRREGERKGGAGGGRDREREKDRGVG